MKHYCDRCTQCRACQALSGAEELDAVRRKQRDIAAAFNAPYAGQVFRGSYESIYTYMFKTTEDPMKIEDAMLIARYGRTFGLSGTPARKKLRKEAIELLTKRAEELMIAAEKKAEAERVLVDVQVYDRSPFARMVQVTRVFSNGSATTTNEDRNFANQLKYTFDQGKKAGERAAYDQKDVS